jgi:Asp-tRNA(Asn)/Glu-tRNA(Gln) amidotransferase B subunit
MTNERMDSTKRRFNPDAVAEFWKKKQQKEDKRIFMDPEKLADEVSDRLVKIMEKEIKKKQTKKAG